MKFKILYALILLTLTACLASAQTITRCGGPTNALYITRTGPQFDVCHTGYNPYETTLSPSRLWRCSALMELLSRRCCLGSPDAREWGGLLRIDRQIRVCR